MSLSLWYLLVPYVIFLIFAGVFLFFNVFHIWRYGVDDLATRSVALAYVLGYLIVLFGSLWILSSYDWSYAPTLDDLMPFSLDRKNLGL